MPEIKDLMQWMDPGQWGFGVLDARTVVVFVGAALLVAGRRLYRLMVLSPGIVGGVLLTHHYAPAGDDLTKLAITIAVGLIGALIMHLMEQTALRMLGAGIVVGLTIAVAPEVFGASVPWYLNYIAAAVGAVGFPMVYKRSLPLLTSLMGALALAWALGRETDVWMIAILTAVGAMIQTFLAGRE